MQTVSGGIDMTVSRNGVYTWLRKTAGTETEAASETTINEVEELAK